MYKVNNPWITERALLSVMNTTAQVTDDSEISSGRVKLIIGSLHHRTNPRDKSRAYGLCDSTMFLVPHKFAQINHEPKNSANGQRLYILFSLWYQASYIGNILLAITGH